jgi:hypothetical protein
MRAWANALLRKAGPALIVATLVGAGQAYAAAVTITNRDSKDYKVTIIEGEKSQDHTLKPAGVLQNICAKGCVVRLNDSENDEYELEGTEVVSIEEGYLYYDVPDSVPEPGAPAKPDERR